MVHGADGVSAIERPPGKSPLPFQREVLAPAVIYLVTAWLGLWMPHPGTNATAVWLTGIEMAARHKPDLILLDITPGHGRLHRRRT